MIRTVLFDLGNTLAEYYLPHEFPPILDRSLAAVRACLEASGREVPLLETMRQRAAGENFESEDHRVRPLRARLERIFGEPVDEAAEAAFLGPIFELGRLYPDTLSTLQSLRERGWRIGIVSNTPWGSPARLWHGELQRLGIVADAAVFCTEVGWRKPAAAIFAHALARLDARAEETLFVGDDPVWDVRGAEAAGMRALLLDRGKGQSLHL